MTINKVSIGLGDKAIAIGGQTCMPFLFEEGEIPNAPRVVIEMLDCEPVEWPDPIRQAIGPASKDPAAWAKKCVSDFGADILCVRLQGARSDSLNRSSDESVAVLKKIAGAVNVPLVVIGCGEDEKDNDLLPKASQELKGRNVLLGIATQGNYKTLAATALADGHSIIAESPIDINIAKQVNILISDMGLDPARIVMHPTTTSLGYGMEYVYSIMERARLAAFIGDKMLAMPFILFVGQETWKTKEAKEAGAVQGVAWETATSVAMIQAGADLVVLRHPDSAKSVKKYIEMMRK